MKLLFSICLALFVMAEEPIAGLLLLVGIALILWRWPRVRFILFVIISIGMVGALWIFAEILDEADIPDLLSPSRPTPTTERAFDPPTPGRSGGTPTLSTAQQTATATAVLGDSRAQVSRARARWLRGDTQAALMAANQAVALAPDDANGLNMRALVRIAAGDFEGAAADAEKAIDEQPSSANYHDTYGYALLKLQRYAEAREEYERALGTLKGPNRAAPQLGYGLALLALGQLSDASIQIQGGLGLLPDANPDPQLADLETSARRGLAGLPITIVSPSALTAIALTTVPSPPATPRSSESPSPLAAASPAATLGTPAPSPAASPAALRADGPLLGKAP